MNLTKEQVLEKVQQGKPLSIVRAGDGEGLVLNCTSSFAALQLANSAVLQRQLGYSPALTDVEAIRQNLIDAYAGADIVGVPMQKNLSSLGSHWNRVTGILDANVGVVLYNKAYCSIDVAYEWLADGSYDKLLANREKLNYISCRDLDEGFKRKYGIKVVNKYTIAPEAKFTSGYEGEPHYPNQFNKANRWMDVVCQPGDLLLVGAGVVGKIYCNWWRDRGGVAVDCGGVFDIWAGKITRGPDRGLDKEDPDTKHKL